MIDIHKVLQRQTDLAEQWIYTYARAIEAWLHKRKDMAFPQDLPAGFRTARQVIQLLKNLGQERYCRPLLQQEVANIQQDVQQQLQQFDSDYRDNNSYNLPVVTVTFATGKVIEIAAVLADGLYHLASELPRDDQKLAQRWQTTADQLYQLTNNKRSELEDESVFRQGADYGETAWFFLTSPPTIHDIRDEQPCHHYNCSTTQKRHARHVSDNESDLPRRRGGRGGHGRRRNSNNDREQPAC